MKNGTYKLYDKTISPPEIISIEGRDRELVLNFNSIGKENSDLFYEYQLENGDWLKLDVTFNPKIDREYLFGKRFKYIEGVYSTGIKEGEYGVIKEILTAEEFDLDRANEFTLSIKTSIKKNTHYSGLLLKDMPGMIGIYHKKGVLNEGAKIAAAIESEGTEMNIQFFLSDTELPDKLHYIISYLPESKEGLKVYVNGKLKGVQSTKNLKSIQGIQSVDLSAVRQVFGLKKETSDFINGDEIHFFKRRLTNKKVQAFFAGTEILSATIGELENGVKYDVRVRSKYLNQISTPAALVYGTPYNKGTQILVENYRLATEGNETQMINQALADGQSENKQVLFGDRTYTYNGSFSLNNGNYNMRGVPGSTEIISTNGFNFTSNGTTKVFGICFNGDQNVPRANRIRNSNGVFEFEQCCFKGGWQRPTGGLAASLSIENSPSRVLLKDCIISDSNSAKPSGVREDSATCRGLYITATSGVIRMEGGEITRVGDLTKNSDGTNIWDGGNHGGGLGWHDLDGLVIQPTGAVTDNNREIHIKGVTFSDCPKRFIKGDSDVKNIFIEDCLFHVKPGRTCNQPVVFQQFFNNDKNYNGHITGCTFRYERGSDFIVLGDSTPGVVQFWGNGSNDQFLCQGNHLEILDSSQPPNDFNGMFSFITEGNGTIRNITIRNNTTSLSNGLGYFLLMRPAAFTSPASASQRGIKNVLVENNVIGNLANEPLRIGGPRNIDCGNCRIYTSYQIHFNNNSYPGSAFEDGDLSHGGWCSECDPNRDNQYLKDITIS